MNVLSRKDYRNSYATILWDNAFPMPNRQLFETEKSVTWSRLAELLSNKFQKDVGLPLKATELEFISSMLPMQQIQPITGDTLISWEQFAKIHLPHRDFTFFEWFYKILILVREQLSEIYCQNLIHGFISSQQAQYLLSNAVDGTFLIRFSETIPGAISIAYVRASKFEKLFPWDIERLKKISLSHTIKCNDFLLFLEPNIPKNAVFSPFYAHSESTRSITGTDYKLDTNIASIMDGNATF